MRLGVGADIVINRLNAYLASYYWYHTFLCALHSILQIAGVLYFSTFDSQPFETCVVEDRRRGEEDGECGLLLPATEGSNAPNLSQWINSTTHCDAPHISPVHVQSLPGTLLNGIYGHEVPIEKCNQNC